jgi:hypothetical protein
MRPCEIGLYVVLNSRTQQQLLSTKDLNLDKAMQIALAMEMATKGSVELQNKGNELHQVNYAKHRYRQNHGQQLKCTCCGKVGHAKSDCRHKENKCYKCGIVGHLKPVCNRDTAPSSSATKSRGKWKNQKSRPVNAVEEEDTDDDIFLNVGLVEDTVHAVAKDAIWVSPKIEGITMKMELDTGAAVTIIPYTDYVKYFHHLQLLGTPTKLRTYGNHVLIPEGILSVDIEYNGQRV